ncbi:hypothetical protein [Streptomyces sp. TRM49041]|uniref:hypothetical protein n=1 Tax=Streptomyces sp. TRM49041 TaxID=2603216 RepID=UPI0021CC4FE2|nr:hypothetical protein [Streptomyces sp. TRM49041]
MTATVGYGYVPRHVGRDDPMADANIRIPAAARDRLAAVAAAEGLSLRAYLSRLADTLLTPEERAAQAEEARRILHEWSGYDPTEEEKARTVAELKRQMAEAVIR